MSMNIEAFKEKLKSEGYDVLVERDWAPLTIVEPHTHPFAAKALVVRGELWLTIGEQTRHLAPGDTFELSSGQVHAERYGTEGATYWVGRRPDPAAQ
jgi:hypothetical protein